MEAASEAAMIWASAWDPVTVRYSLLRLPSVLKPLSTSTLQRPSPTGSTWPTGLT